MNASPISCLTGRSTIASSSGAYSSTNELSHEAHRESGHALPFPTLQAMAQYIAENGCISYIDSCFCDPTGLWRHCHFSRSTFTLDAMNEGFSFDGSSMPLFETVDKGDLLMKPDPHSCWLDPFSNGTVLHTTCFICTADGSAYHKCPRTIAQRCRNAVVSSGIADEVWIAAEAEFFIFNSASFSVQPRGASFAIDGCEGDNGLAGVSHGHSIRPGGSYMIAAPMDGLSDTRSKILTTLASLGIDVIKHHHEAASCQVEVGVQPADILQAADCMMGLKYVCKNVAMQRRQTVTFMPKPVADENGSGMHVNISLWKNGANLFHDDRSQGLAKLSDLALSFVAGLLLHSPALSALCNPTVNSYRRLCKGFEAPTKLAYGVGNRTAAIRIPAQLVDRAASKRVEFRSPDASCCPYLAYAAIVMAGLDGIRRGLRPPPPIAFDICHSDAEQAQAYADLPQSLDEALDALEADHAFLLVDKVFAESFVREYVVYKRKEAAGFRRLAHPREYQLYYGC